MTAGNVRLNYVEHGSGDEPLVFVHGYTGSLRDWDDVLPRLPEWTHGYAIDLRGAGDSDRPGSGYTIPQYVEDLELATRALGIDTFTLVGHSMGGLTAMQFAATHPERLRRLVLVAPVSSGGLTPFDPAMREQMKQLRRNRDLAKAMARAFMVRPRTDEQLDRSIDDNLKWEDDAFDEAYESMRTINLSDTMSKLTIPTLMIAGDRDFLRADNLADAQRIPNCALQVFYRVGHMIQSDVPDEFTATLMDFVQNGVAAPVSMAQRSQILNEMVAT
ncbi:MAG TPA: alpha/beta hydrolase [Vicinamibacterales bacterium]|nr:alpha/beta hydrolase [Vicinamibacterales bacterium]